jgi:hypothetical protein
MTERSLFNVACKLLGLYFFFRGVTSLVWAFLASRFDSTLTPFEPTELASWFSGAVYTVFGFLFCGRSSWITQVMFRLDGAVDSLSSEEKTVD